MEKERERLRKRGKGQQRVKSSVACGECGEARAKRIKNRHSNHNNSRILTDFRYYNKLQKNLQLFVRNIHFN